MAATLSAVGHIPVAGLALILGIDRFMSEARALTNLVGNSLATIVVAKWVGALDKDKLNDALNNPDEVDRKMLAQKSSGCRGFRLIQIYLYKKGSFGFLFIG